MPDWRFTVCVIGTQIFALLMGVYGAFSMFGLESEACGWAWGLGVLDASFLIFMILDYVKVYLFRVWSLELVAKLWPSPAIKAKVCCAPGRVP